MKKAITQGGLIVAIGETVEECVKEMRKAGLIGETEEYNPGDYPGNRWATNETEACLDITDTLYADVNTFGGDISWGYSDRWHVAYSTEGRVPVDDDEDECPDCETPAEELVCDECGERARLINCGHYPQPRPISGYGDHTYCDACWTEFARDFEEPVPKKKED